MIDSADQSPAPQRVVMGSDSDKFLSAADRARSAAQETQKELAFSTDY